MIASCTFAFLHIGLCIFFTGLFIGFMAVYASERVIENVNKDKGKNVKAEPLPDWHGPLMDQYQNKSEK
jgi:hypothetical protein